MKIKSSCILLYGRKGYLKRNRNTWKYLDSIISILLSQLSLSQDTCKLNAVESKRPLDESLSYLVIYVKLALNIHCTSQFF